MGFNNDGAAVVAAPAAPAARHAASAATPSSASTSARPRSSPAEDAVADYVESARLLAPFADYLVVNVSSPNTPGLRDLQAVDELRPLLAAVKAVATRRPAGRVPLVVKIAPDLADDDVDAVADLALELGLDGISATNTTIARPAGCARRATSSTPPAPAAVRPGAGRSRVEVLVRCAPASATARAHRRRRGHDADDVRARLDAGADLVQGYTGFIYGGPALAIALAGRVANRPERQPCDPISESGT